jgi:hypothetical protein
VTLVFLAGQGQSVVSELFFGSARLSGHTRSMAQNLIQIAILGMFAASGQAQILNGPHDLEWTNWQIKINHLEFTNYVTRYTGEQKAAADSIFVYMEMTVTNIGHKGNTFVPQNTLKIVKGGNEFDAADLDGVSESYVSNVEPTLSRERKCYFELPLGVVKDSFIIRFSGFLTETKDIKISISTPDPTPESQVAQSPPAPAVDALAASNVVSSITKNRWTAESLIVSGTLTNTSTVAVLITGIDAKGYDQDQKMVTRGSDFTIVRKDLAPGDVVNFKVALKDDAKQVKFVRVMPSWSLP